MNARWDPETLLSASGHRVTPQRRAVLSAIGRTESALTATQVYDAARRACPDLGLATVYRTLELLVEAGALRRMYHADRCEAFVPAHGRHGHSVVCSQCGRVREFTACDVRALAAAAAEETGYEIEDHFLQLSGICGACRGEPGERPIGRRGGPIGRRR